MFNKIKDIRTPVKIDILKLLLDGDWHRESDILRMAKKQQHLGGYMGAVTLATMVGSLNNMLKSEYVEKQFMNGELSYKISDNFVGLSRAAYNRYRFILK